MEHGEKYEDLWLEEAREIANTKASRIIQVITDNDFVVAKKNEILYEVACNQVGVEPQQGPDYPPTIGDWDTDEMEKLYHNSMRNHEFIRTERTGLIGHLPHALEAGHLIRVNPELRWSWKYRDLPDIYDLPETSVPDRSAEDIGLSSVYDQRSQTIQSVADWAETIARHMKQYIGLMKDRGELPTPDEEGSDYGSGIPDFGLQVMLYGRVAIFLDTVVNPRVTFDTFRLSSSLERSGELPVEIDGRLEADELTLRRPSDVEWNDRGMADVPMKKTIEMVVDELIKAFFAESFYNPHRDRVRSLDKEVMEWEPKRDPDEGDEEDDYDPYNIDVLRDDDEFPELTAIDKDSDAYRWLRLKTVSSDVNVNEAENEIDFTLQTNQPPVN